MQERSATMRPAQLWPGLPSPKDALAWWAFVSSSLTGAAMVWVKAPAKAGQALWLVLACACLFLAGDWVSSLSGRSVEGEVPKGRLLAPQALVFLLAGACLTRFVGGLSSVELHFWVVALACGASLTVLMFILRLEMQPYDGRLVALSSLLCTLPALYLAFLAFGPGVWDAWAFWLVPALYFPVSTVFAWTWLQGLYQGKVHLALLAAPLLILIVIDLGGQATVSALVTAAYLAYLVRRLLARYRHQAGRMPEFSDILSLGREQVAWNAVVALSWLFHGLLP